MGDLRKREIFGLNVGFSKGKRVIFASMGDLRKHMIFGLNGGFSKRKCLVFWLQQKTRDFRLNVGFEKTRDFRLNVGFSKRKRVIFT